MSGSFWFAWVFSGAPRSRRVQSGSRGLTLAHLGVVAFIVGLFQVGLGSFMRAQWLPRSLELDRFHSGQPSGPRVDLDLLGFTWAGLEFVGFIRVREGLLELA